MSCPGYRWWLVTALLLVGGCASLSRGHIPSAEISPLLLPQNQVTLEQVSVLAPTPDLLALDEEMVAFVERYTRDLRSQRQRLTSLHRSLKSAGLLNIQYDPHAEGSAIEAFHRGTVNCLSYANLMVAMAREAGLDARYQWVDVRPHWSRMGDRVAVRLHVNVLLKVNRGEQVMADIDPLQARDITSTHILKDKDAQALYHSNVAMTALAEKRLTDAYAHAVRAVQISPYMAHLWVNLGAVYRVADQHVPAERSYLHALKLDASDRSAMNNLIVLYEMQGRMEERKRWLGEISRYQRANPYYHAWKGDKAGELGDWAAALKYYRKALDINPKDSFLLFTTGLIYSKLQDIESARKLITRAIEHATLRREIDSYELTLRALENGPLAGL